MQERDFDREADEYLEAQNERADRFAEQDEEVDRGEPDFDDFDTKAEARYERQFYGE